MLFLANWVLLFEVFICLLWLALDDFTSNETLVSFVLLAFGMVFFNARDYLG